MKTAFEALYDSVVKENLMAGNNQQQTSTETAQGSGAPVPTQQTPTQPSSQPQTQQQNSNINVNDPATIKALEVLAKTQSTADVAKALLDPEVKKVLQTLK